MDAEVMVLERKRERDRARQRIIRAEQIMRQSWVTHLIIVRVIRTYTTGWDRGW